MGKPAARLTDMHVCPMVTGIIPHVGGPIAGPGCPTVIIGGLPAARVTDMGVCVGPPDLIALGSTGVLIGGLPAARMGDMTAHGGSIVFGWPTVLIGDAGGGGGGGGAASKAGPPVKKAARSPPGKHKVKPALSRAAVKAANEALWKAHPELRGRQLTMGPKDAALRKEWMQSYRAAAAGERTPSGAPAQGAGSKVTTAQAAIKELNFSFGDASGPVRSNYPNMSVAGSTPVAVSPRPASAAALKFVPAAMVLVAPLVLALGKGSHNGKLDWTAAATQLITTFIDTKPISNHLTKTETWLMDTGLDYVGQLGVPVVKSLFFHANFVKELGDISKTAIAKSALFNIATDEAGLVADYATDPSKHFNSLAFAADASRVAGEKALDGLITFGMTTVGGPAGYVASIAVTHAVDTIVDNGIEIAGNWGGNFLYKHGWY
jgi:uncharacterized Zn-binding protein involved in type VI secretion